MTDSKPHLIVGIPWHDRANRPEQTLRDAYADFVDGLKPGEAGVMLDHDVLFMTHKWYEQIQTALAENPQYGLLTAIANRTVCPWQEVHGMPYDERRELGKSDDISEHIELGYKLLEEHGSTVVDATGWSYEGGYDATDHPFHQRQGTCTPMGYVSIIRPEAVEGLRDAKRWKDGSPGRSPVLGFDGMVSELVWRNGYKIGVLPGLYVFHIYRGLFAQAASRGAYLGYYGGW